MNQTDTDIAVDFNGVCVVFGDRPEAALPLMDKGLERAEIHAMCGQILGVHNCTLQLKRGEILVLMGLSGSGKSTLLRAVNGLNSIARGALSVSTPQGRIELSSIAAAQLTALRRQHIAMVFQQFGLLPWRTVAENVGLGLELAGAAGDERADRVARQLELVGLTDRADARIAELSGGMQQRVGLARAYATDASILLMDEPFSALDPLIRDHLQGELLDHQKKLGCSIIFVSHDLDEAFRLGHRIAIMEGGRIVQTGTPREIFHAPSTEYVANFVAQINPMTVLTAQDIIPFSAVLSADASADNALDISTPVSQLVTRLTMQDTPLTITMNGRPCGQIDRAALLACLASHTKN